MFNERSPGFALSPILAPSPSQCWQIHRCLAGPMPVDWLWVHCPKALYRSLPSCTSS